MSARQWKDWELELAEFHRQAEVAASANAQEKQLAEDMDELRAKKNCVQQLHFCKRHLAREAPIVDQTNNRMKREAYYERKADLQAKLDKALEVTLREQQRRRDLAETRKIHKATRRVLHCAAMNFRSTQLTMASICQRVDREEGRIIEIRHARENTAQQKGAREARAQRVEHQKKLHKARVDKETAAYRCRMELLLARGREALAKEVQSRHDAVLAEHNFRAYLKDMAREALQQDRAANSVAEADLCSRYSQTLDALKQLVEEAKEYSLNLFAADNEDEHDLETVFEELYVKAMSPIEPQVRSAFSTATPGQGVELSAPSLATSAPRGSESDASPALDEAATAMSSPCKLHAASDGDQEQTEFASWANADVPRVSTAPESTGANAAQRLPFAAGLRPFPQRPLPTAALDFSAASPLPSSMPRKSVLEPSTVRNGTRSLSALRRIRRTGPMVK